ncbi:MAG: hypothetical protein Kow0042_10430 [Calditrichia bacterium]
MDLSSMQKYRFIQYLIASIAISITAVFAGPEHWFNLYRENNIAALHQLQSSNQIDDPDWRKFVDILFIEEMNEALPEYIALYEKSHDELLKRAILDRISQYYYAKGLYETASKILDDDLFRNQIFAIKKENIFFGVQLGAFSTYENALKLRQRFSKAGMEVNILTKNRSGKKLYVVIAGKYTSHQEANRLLGKIKKDYGHKGLVVQY